MIRRHIVLSVALVCLLQAARGVCAAPTPAPHIGYVYPAGGQQGTAFEVKVGGQYLEKVLAAQVSGSGVTVKVLEYIEPEEKRKAREPLKLAATNAVVAVAVTNTVAGGVTNATEATATNAAAERATNVVAATRTSAKADPPKPIEVRMKKMGGKKQKNWQLEDTVRLSVVVAANAQPGERQIRLRSPSGISNPLRFDVGSLPEITETEANYSTNCRIALLPVLVNGQILPGEAKTYTLAAKKGMHLVARAQARSLIPYLADAVPGWFQAFLSLTDTNGNRVSFADHYRFDPDPVLLYDVPADGDYVLTIRDSIYRGRQDFVYRLAIGELPVARDPFPPGGLCATSTAAQVTGENLPANREDAGTAAVCRASVRSDALLPNPVPFATDSLPERNEIETNDDAPHAQPVQLPVIVNGRIARPGDVDTFRFEGATGDRVVAEVYARRLGSPLDSIVRLLNAQGDVLAENDDHEDKGSGLTTHHADSYLLVALPTNGAFRVRIGDVQGKGGDAYAYRLRLSAPQPGFALRVVPSGVNLAQGGWGPVTVYALRRDGFEGEIKVSATGLPEGIALKTGVITNKGESVRLSFSAPEEATLACLRPSIQGVGKIRGTNVLHAAVPADDLTQAFSYHHLVPAAELLLNVVESTPVVLTPDLPKGQPVRIPVGGSATVAINSAGRPFSGKVHLVLDRPPPGLSLDDIAPTSGAKRVEIVLRADGAAASGGTNNTLTIHGIRGKKIVYASPAVPFEVTKPETPAD